MVRGISEYMERKCMVRLYLNVFKHVGRVQVLAHFYSQNNLGVKQYNAQLLQSIYFFNSFLRPLPCLPSTHKVFYKKTNDDLISFP